MNQKTTRFRQDAFAKHDELPGDIAQSLSNDIASSGMRTESLHITLYTSGDTSGKPDKGLPEVAEASAPKRISRKYIPLQSSNSKSQDAVFPQSENDSEFSWKPTGFQNDTFVSVKDAQQVQPQVSQEKGGPSREVIGLLKQLGHSDAGEIGQSSQANITSNAIQEKSIVVNMSPTNLTNAEFNNYISTTTNDNRTYNIQSETVIRPSSVFVSRASNNSSNQSNRDIRSKNQTGEAVLPSNDGTIVESITSEPPISVANSNRIKTTRNATQDVSSSTYQSNADVYEQVRSVLGESKQDWKQVIKTAKSTTNTSTPGSTTTGGNSTIAAQENQIDQVVQKILSQEANSRTELEHMLTHKFSTELISMQQSMDKKIQGLREAFGSFMMR